MFALLQIAIKHTGAEWKRKTKTCLYDLTQVAFCRTLFESTFRGPNIVAQLAEKANEAVDDVPSFIATRLSSHFQTSMQNQQPAVRPPSLRRGIVVFSAYPPAEVLAPIKPTTERRSPLVTVLTVGRRYVNHIDHGLAVQRVRSKRCEVLTKNKNRLITIIDKEAHLEDRLPGGISTTYRQKLCDIHQVQTLKRAIGSRANYRLVIWDKRLKFSEIGIGGRELSAETVRVRAEQKAQDQALKRTGFVEYPVW